MWITTNCGKFFKKLGIPDHLICLLRNLFAGQEATVRTGDGEKTGSKLGKEYIKAIYCLPYLLSLLFNLYAEYIMRMPGWMKHKLESRLSVEISITSDAQMTPSLWQKVKRN